MFLCLFNVKVCAGGPESDAGSTRIKCGGDKADLCCNNENLGRESEEEQWNIMVRFLCLVVRDLLSGTVFTVQLTFVDMTVRSSLDNGDTF